MKNAVSLCAIGSRLCPRPGAPPRTPETRAAPGGPPSAPPAVAPLPGRPPSPRRSAPGYGLSGPARLRPSAPAGCSPSTPARGQGLLRIYFRFHDGLVEGEKRPKVLNWLISHFHGSGRLRRAGESMNPVFHQKTVQLRILLGFTYAKRIFGVPNKRLGEFSHKAAMKTEGEQNLYKEKLQEVSLRIWSQE
uniref:uncharacterized protein LOC143386515 n=1 Tax=Callospermophilus lateralis TaxID=76772 RepID=UPI0040386E34